nr:unnamed protein product [Callosobruchus analis]
MESELQELQEFKNKRKIIKQKISRVKNLLLTLDKDNLSASEKRQWEIRLSKYEPLWDEFEKIQTYIELMEESDLDESERSYINIVVHLLLMK